LVRLALTIIATLAGSIVLERTAQWAVRLLERIVLRLGPWKTLATGGLTAVCLGGALISSELCIRKFAPQEVFGWGELASLQASPEFGWHLKPSHVTRLRWLSYDYTVQANRLGFPGPEYAVARSPSTVRILVTGDAYSSAEGVDTEMAWPRVLESKLKEQLPRKTPEVLNFAITGYGPTQDAAIIDHFVPLYRPDVVIVEMFLNDFDDETLGDSIRDGIGFDNPNSQTGLKGVLRLAHLKAWTSERVALLKQAVTGKPSAQASFFSGLMWLGSNATVFDPHVQARVKTRLAHMRDTISQNGGRFIVLSVPAAIQVCDAAELPYLTGVKIDLSQVQQDAPQNVLLRLCNDLGIEFVDLRPALKGSKCLYQPHNLHWIAEAHTRVGDFVAKRVQGPSR
jgi:hypothetical protein